MFCTTRHLLMASFSPEEKLEMQRRRLRGAEHEVLTEDFSVPSLDELLASTTATAAPTGINPAAPASSQPPAVTNPVGSIAPTVITTAAPNKYSRKEGVTLDDRLQSLAMTMSALAHHSLPMFTQQQTSLLPSKRMLIRPTSSLDEGTRPTIDVLSNGDVVTRAAKYIRNADNTYSINPDAGKG